MKSKYILLGLLAAMCSCEDFLDTDNFVKKDTSNFPELETDATMMLTGIYSTLNHQVGQWYSNHPDKSLFFVAQMASDDLFGGGGPADRTFQMSDKLMSFGPDAFEPFWKATYEGIYRCNMLLECQDKVQWEGETSKNQTIGEAYFMRAFFYFQLAQMFGQVPMPLSSAPENLPKSDAETLYAQIASDMKKGIEIMPARKYESSLSGHASKYIAEAYMARIFLFYTGYYKKDVLPLAEGGNIEKSQVITWLEDCRDNSGFGLVDDFRELWPYTNEFTVNSYKYTMSASDIKGGALEWATDVNKENMFAVKFDNYASWQDYGRTNLYCLYNGVRSQKDLSKTYPFGQGWGCSTVNTKLFEEWKADEPTDMRRQASIIDLNDPSEGIDYLWEGNDQMEATGYLQKKYISINGKDKDGNMALYSSLKYGTQNEFQLGHTQDLVLMRFADVLLMHSELTGTPDGMNAVRARAGLAPLPYTLDNLKKERRHELAFEGIRWFDLMRWGDAPEALEAQIGVPIVNNGVKTVMKSFGPGFTKRYEDTGGFWPIPQAQIDLSNGVLEQNKGWGTPESEFSGW